MPSYHRHIAGNRLIRVAVVVALFSVCGCSGSNENDANARVEQLSLQAASWLETGKLDEARRTIDEALAVEGATQTGHRDDLARRIDEACLARDAEEFDRRASDAIEKVLEMDPTDRGNAAAVVAEAVPQASPVQHEMAERLVAEIHRFTTRREATRFWEGFDLQSLTDFREKAALPDEWNASLEVAGSHGDALRRLWRETLERTLPDALAQAEIKADMPVDPDHSLPSLTIEQVAADPESWLDQRIQFERVWISGRVNSTLRLGQLLTVTSEADKVYEPRIDEGRLVFVSDRKIAHEIKSSVAEGSKARVRLFCRIEQARDREPTRATAFYRALVFKFELYHDE